MEFTISCLLTLQMLQNKFGKDWPSSSSEEDINGRRKTHDDRRQPIAIGHLGDSGDLKLIFKSGICYINYLIIIEVSFQLM